MTDGTLLGRMVTTVEGSRLRHSWELRRKADAAVTSAVSVKGQSKVKHERSGGDSCEE